MGRPKAVKHADGTITGAKVFTNEAREIGELIHGKELTYSHGGEIDCLNAITKEWEENGRVSWDLRHYKYVLQNRGLLKIVKGAPPPYHHSEDNVYIWVGLLMSNARDAEWWGRDSWRLQNDRKTERGYYHYNSSLRGHVRDLATQRYPYYVNLWAGQERRIVIVTEKGGLYGALQSYGNPYGVVVVAGMGGFGTTTTKHDVAEDLKEIVAEGQDVTILYVGDHDPGGLAIERDFNESLERYGYHGEPMERIAVTREQAMDPAQTENRQPVQGKYVGNARYLEETGLDYGVQVESFLGMDLRRIVTKAIEERINLAALEDARAVNAAVSEWLGDHFGTIISDYEDMEEPLDITIRREAELIDHRTHLPLADNLVETYLPKDEGEEDEDDEE